MAGIRVEHPIGEGWQYSLDGETWQESPVFATQLGGAAFVAGIKYKVYCLQSEEELVAVAEILFQNPTNQDDLQAVTSRGGRTTKLLEILGGLVLGGLEVATEDWPELRFNPATGKVGVLASAITLPPELTVVSVGDLYTLRTLVWIMRFDKNDCDDFRGWAFDPANPLTAPQVKIKRDGVVAATLTCDIDRFDVRDYLIAQGKLPVGTTFAKYGWAYEKTPGDADGQPHTFVAQNPAGTVQATSDVGAPSQVTCGASVNPAPQLAVPQGMILITGAGTQTIPAPEGEFTDNEGDTHRYEGYRRIVETDTNFALPILGISLDTTTGEFSLTADVPDGAYVLRRVYVDGASQHAIDDLKVYVNRALALVGPSTDVNDHSNDFSANLGTDFSDTGYSAGDGSWTNTAGVLKQTATAGSSQRVFFFSENGSQDSLDAIITLARIKPTALSSDSRIGIGLRFSLAGTDGYSLVIKDSGHVQLLKNGTYIGAPVSFAVSADTWYYGLLKYEETGSTTAKLSAKIWNCLLPEPAEWTIVLDGQARQSGYPALLGGMGSAKADFDDWADSTT